MGDVIPAGLTAEQRRRLWRVVAIAAGAFMLEQGIGSLSPSQALKADSLDFLAMGLGSGLSLWAIGRSAEMRMMATLARAALLVLIGGLTALATLYQFLVHAVPEPASMAAGALAALAANGVAFYLLRQQGPDDALQSGRLAARNDAIGTGAVLVAAGLVAVTDTAAPDLVVAGVMVVLFMGTALPALDRAWRDWRAMQTPGAPQGGQDPAPASPSSDTEAE